VTTRKAGSRRASSIAFRREHTDPGIFKEMGDLGFAGARPFPRNTAAAGLNYVSYGAHRARDRAHRFGISIHDERAVVPRDAADRPFSARRFKKRKYLPALGARANRSDASA